MFSLEQTRGGNDGCFQKSEGLSQERLSFFHGRRQNKNQPGSKGKKLTYSDGGIVKGTQESTEKAPNGQSWNNFRNKINKVILDYNPKFKINIHEPILI